ncbi:class I adenylate-forming enzyme family protein [Amycolatopsis endophytica]|uniref:Fatty-acyl-CoA synthase n=1 Tax=Amycolatopsis endophytica TaxID=860233 RepID=A0A853B1J1_9PSEU|nr:AMP-binding protein [Amycolatopsis endophytica]NYI88704.1 fatty-acyl-CoA synthase [Amycolatopsis endophytica]
MSDLDSDRKWIEATTLGDLLDRRAAEHPQRTALSFPGVELTFRELAERADHFARGLLTCGLRAGDTVGVLMSNCPDAIAVVFGAMKIGVVPVPVNARFKGYELGIVVRHSAMRLLVTHGPDGAGPDFPALLGETFPGQAGAGLAGTAVERVVVLGDPAPAPFLSEEEFAELAGRADPAEVRRRQELVRVRDTAIVMYTSGTSASPKGAMLSHEAITRYAAGLARTRFFLVPEDRVWTPLPLFHIGGLAFAFATVHAGCTYCHAGVFKPADALDDLERQRATVVLVGFETIWLPVVNQPDFAQRDLASIRAVMCVGVPERLRDMASRLPHATQVSCFGMTEASSFLALNHLTDSFDQRTGTGGHPLPGMECRVVDPATGADLPPGTEGELLFRGSNCFDGYFRDPELTASVFDEEGWFHTGDVATLDPEGRVTFVSRVKDMLKVGGENVSAVEVEDYLLRHPAVAIAQVVSAPDAHYVEVPAVYIQLAPGAAVTEQEIIDFCLGSIATFRVPRYVRFVTEWPMSGTKIKKYVLREWIAAELAEAGITEAPRLRPPALHSDVSPA